MMIHSHFISRSYTLTTDEEYTYVTVLEPSATHRNSTPEPSALLHQQKYFHGAINRIEAEALLKKDGQFLVRESTRYLGQYVLTGMANGRPCHYLLMDSDGKVSPGIVQGVVGLAWGRT